MKKLNFLMLSSCFVVFGAFAQTNKEVKKFIGNYEADMNRGAFEKSLDYIYPKLYEVVPRETMEEALIAAFLDTSVFKMGFDKFEVSEIGEKFTEDSISYVFVKYSILMHMDFINPETSNEEIQSIGEVMKNAYGEENVKIEPRKFTITTQNRMAVIKHLKSGQLFLLEISDQLKPVFETIMSTSFVERAY